MLKSKQLATLKKTTKNAGEERVKNEKEDFTFIRHLSTRHHLVQQNPERPDVRFHREALVNRSFGRRPPHGDLCASTGRINAVLETRDGKGLTDYTVTVLLTLVLSK